MKNIHIVPTEKSSRLFITDGKLFNYHKPQKGDGVKIINQNIYITSDEALPYDSSIFDSGAFYHRDPVGDVYIITKDTFKPNPHFCKRIILTTDQDLIKDGVQAIDDEFLEWFVKNPSCDSVDVVNDEYVDLEKDEYIDLYKIIIPKEERIYAWVGAFDETINNYTSCRYELKDIYQGENCLPNFKTKEECQYWCDNDSPFAIPKLELEMLEVPMPIYNQETLEEAAEIYASHSLKEERQKDLNMGFKAGAKWQAERMYSDMEEYADYCLMCSAEKTLKIPLPPKEWFEQFKKK
jgi:hypothetical protein